jgi:hypothetical protein
MDRDWTASFSIRFRNGTCIIILDQKYIIANSSCHFGSYGSIWTGPSPKKYYNDLRSFGPYNIFFVTDRFIYCHMTLSAMNYLLFVDLCIYIFRRYFLYLSRKRCYFFNTSIYFWLLISLIYVICAIFTFSPQKLHVLFGYCTAHNHFHAI